MQRIDTATKSVDLFGAGRHGYKDGNKALGIAPTDFNAASFNAIQEEICNAIEYSGVALDSGDNTQLLTSLLAGIISGSAGYIKHPCKDLVSGLRKNLICQWGGINQESRAVGNYTIAQTFTITFPANVFIILPVATCGGYIAGATAGAATTSGFNLGLYNNAGAPISLGAFWLAVGI